MLGGDHHETDDFNMPPPHKVPFPASGAQGAAVARANDAIHASRYRKAHHSQQEAQDLHKNKNKPRAIITLNKSMQLHQARNKTPHLLFLISKFLIVQVSLQNASHKHNKAAKETLGRIGNLAGMATIWQNAIKLCPYCMASVFTDRS